MIFTMATIYDLYTFFLFDEGSFHAATITGLLLLGRKAFKRYQ